MKRILITGSSGYIGKSLVKRLSADNLIFGFDLVETLAVKEMILGDIRDETLQQQVFKSIRPDVIIHTAANKSVPWCEKNRDEAYKIHYEASKSLIEQSKTKHFIYLSSDMVFSGNKGNYKLDDKREPINYYGKMKSCVEDLLLDNPNGTICRTALVFGLNSKELNADLEKYLTNPAPVIQSYFLDHVVKRLSVGQHVELPYDEYASPTTNILLSNQISRIIEIGFKGIAHCSGSTRISRYDFGRLIAQIYNLPTSKIISVAHSDPLRPLDVSLDTIQTQKNLKMSFPPLKESIIQLGEYVA